MSLRALLLGDHALDGRQQVAVDVELHERAIGVGPDLDAGVLELNEQRRLPRGVARKPIQIAQDEHVEGSALCGEEHGLKLGAAQNLGAALVVVDEDAVGGEVPGLRRRPMLAIRLERLSRQYSAPQNLGNSPPTFELTYFSFAPRQTDLDFSGLVRHNLSYIGARERPSVVGLGAATPMRARGPRAAERTPNILPVESRTMRRLSSATGATLLVALCAPRTAYAQSTTYLTESVNNYGGNNLPNSIANGEGFRSNINGGVVGFTSGADWQDQNVYDRDFVDNNLNGLGLDSIEFDPPGTAISYFTGHGTSDDGFPTPPQLCQGSGNTFCLANANPWGTGVGTCRHQPGQGSVSLGTAYGYCAYATDRIIVTHGGGDVFNGWIDYSTGSLVAFGESPSSGSWRGAGTNGGTNVAVLDLSNGMEPGFAAQNLIRAFAGVHMIATLMPTGGDTGNVSDRGSWFSAFYKSNANNGVASSWIETTILMPNEGQACGTNGVTNGGYGGFNGCGCNVVSAAGATSSEVSSHLAENWHNITDDTRDGKSAAWFGTTWICNFNTSQDPWSL